MMHSWQHEVDQAWTIVRAAAARSSQRQKVFDRSWARCYRSRRDTPCFPALVLVDPPSCFEQARGRCARAVSSPSSMSPRALPRPRPPSQQDNDMADELEPTAEQTTTDQKVAAAVARFLTAPLTGIGATIGLLAGIVAINKSHGGPLIVLAALGSVVPASLWLAW